MEEKERKVGRNSGYTDRDNRNEPKREHLRYRKGARGGSKLIQGKGKDAGKGREGTKVKVNQEK